MSYEFAEQEKRDMNFRISDFLIPIKGPINYYNRTDYLNNTDRADYDPSDCIEIALRTTVVGISNLAIWGVVGLCAKIGLEKLI